MRRTTLVLSLLLLVSATAAGELATVQETTLQDATGSAGGFLDKLGPWAYVIAPLLMIVVAILPIPAEFPAMLNGMLFGAAVGTAITWGGAVLGALISFELARRFGRPLAMRLLKKSALDRCDRLVASAGWPGLMLLRLLPVIAFTAINWCAGLTSMNRWTFVWTTALGILPGAIFFTVSGTGLAALYRMNPAAAVGLALFAGLVVWLTISRYRGSRLRLWTGEYQVTDS